MSILSFFKKNQNDGTFVSKKSFQKNFDNQAGMAPETLNQIRSLSDANELSLEYFFYTNTVDKAEKLATELALLNYTCKFETSNWDKSLFVITGWTHKIKMTDETVIEWTKEMCHLGYRFDCEFDGWGTNPNQE